MTVGDVLEKYSGEIRVFNEYDEKDVGIIDTTYKAWVKVSYWNCEVTKLEFEMLNTAVLSARLVVKINDEHAGEDPGDVEEATKEDIDDLVDNIYKDVDHNNMTEDEETIRVITEDYYDHQPLPGDEHDFGDHDAEEATDAEVEEIIDDVYPNQSGEESTQNDEEDDVEEATQEDIDNLLGDIYND